MTNPRTHVCKFTLYIGSILFISIFGVRASHAGLIFESATLGPTGQSGGIFVNNEFFAGTWFSLTETTQVTAIGGHVSISTSSPGVWTSIVSLSPGTLPSPSFDIESSSLVSGLLTPTLGPSEDHRVNVNATLGPGDYAILMGGTFSGMPSSGVMAQNNTDLPGSNYFGRTSSGGWDDNINRNGIRLVVEGVTAVPEPSSLTMLAVASIGFLTSRRRGRNKRVQPKR